jgi:serine protease inhibitor ecotin
MTLGTPRVSCGCTSAAVSKNTVAPGESAAVVAYMDTRRIPTPNITKSVLIYVPFLSPTQEEVTLKVQTVARDDLMMSPDTLAFGAVKLGAGAIVKTKVTFMSDPNWQVTGASSTGGYVKTEFKEAGRQGSMVTYEVSAILDKACPSGSWVSDIHLTTSNTAVAKLRIPVTVTVTPGVAITPESAAFGNLPIGVQSEKKITIKAGSPFKILEVRGSDEQLKVVVERSDASDVHTILLAAYPKAAGGFTRTVEIVTDNKEQPTVVIPVTAKVIPK